MNVYFIILLVLLIIQGNTIKDRKVFLFVAFLELLFISGLRVPDTYGSDTRAYCDMFVDLINVKVSHIISSDSYEWGFNLFCHLLSFLSKDPQILLFVSSLIMTGAVIIFILKRSKDPGFSVLLYITLLFFFNNLNLMRFGLSMSILLFSINSVVNRHFLKFAVIVAVASLFHFSALLFLMIYFVYPLKITGKRMFLFLIPFVFLIYAFQMFFEILISINSRYTSYDQGGGIFYASSYANIVMFLINVTMFLFAWRKNRIPINKLCGYEKFFFLSSFLAVMFSFIAINVMIVTRFIIMFSIVNIVYIPNVVRGIRNKKNAFAWKTGIIAWSIIYMVLCLTYRLEWFMINPYSNIVFKDLL